MTVRPDKETGIRNRIALACSWFLPAALVWATGAAAAKPVAVVGTKAEATAIVQQVLLPENIAYDVADEWLEPEEYQRYAAIYLADSLRGLPGTPEQPWSPPAARDTVAAYLKDGGVIIMTGPVSTELADTTLLAPLVGFAGTKRFDRGELQFRLADPGSALARGLEDIAYGWHPGRTGADGLSTARAVAREWRADGSPGLPLVTTNDVGRGRVAWFSTPLYRMCLDLAPHGEEADEEGTLAVTKAAVDLAA